MPVLYSRHLDHRYRYLLPKPVRLKSYRVSRGAGVCGWLEGRIRRGVVLQKLCFGDASYNFLCPFGFYYDTLIRQSTNTREKRLERERNVLKLSVAVVVGFALCWLPLSIKWFMLFNSDRTITSSCGFYYFSSVSLFLAWSNCPINPWICICFGGNYRQGLKNLLGCSSFVSPLTIKMYVNKLINREALSNGQTELLRNECFCELY